MNQDKQKDENTMVVGKAVCNEYTISSDLTLKVTRPADKSAPNLAVCNGSDPFFKTCKINAVEWKVMLQVLKDEGLL